MSAVSPREAAMRAALAAEPDWPVLLRHFDFNAGFAFILVLVESAENAALCREALGDYLREHGKGSVRLIACNFPEDAQNLPLLLHHPKGLDANETLWIESVVPEGSVTEERLEEWKLAWRVCFAGLNRIRNTIQRTVPCALVFCVAPWVQNVISRIAPDFWSIRSIVVRLSPRVPTDGIAAVDGARFQRPETDPALAPDPEFAEREAERLRNRPGNELELARILQRAGAGYSAQGKPVEAIRCLEEAFAIQEAGSGPPFDLSETRSLLGRAYLDNAQWDKAEVCFRQALAADRDRLPEDHPTIVVDLSDLAGLLQATNRFAEAEPLMFRALAIDEKSYGPDHPDVAVGLNNLAQLLQATGRLAEAEPLMRRALTIDEKNYGLDHPNVGIRLNNLAQLLQATGRLAEAEPLMRRALAVAEKSFGPDHPKVAIYLNNLALLLQETSRPAEAEPLMRRALAVAEKSFGPDHPKVGVRLNNLALLLQATGRLAEAEPLMFRALAIYEKSYGPDHPDVAVGLNNLALLLKATNRLAEAEPLMRRALAVAEKSFGPDHPDVAIDLSNLARLLQETNRPAEAEPLMRRALAIDEKSYGPDHPDVAIDLSNLARLLQETNRPAEADPLLRRALAIFEEFGARTGHPHPDFDTVRGNYDLLLQELGSAQAQDV